MSAYTDVVEQKKAISMHQPLSQKKNVGWLGKARTLFRKRIVAKVHPSQKFEHPGRREHALRQRSLAEKGVVYGKRVRGRRLKGQPQDFGNHIPNSHICTQKSIENAQHQRQTKKKRICGARKKGRKAEGDQHTRVPPLGHCRESQRIVLHALLVLFEFKQTSMVASELMGISEKRREEPVSKKA
jgi:hypothetical protein